jgi:hypothetical protein
MLGLQSDVTGCAESMQEMLYGIYCNDTFRSHTNEFLVCDDLCSKVHDRCQYVDVMVPDSPFGMYGLTNTTWSAALRSEWDRIHAMPLAHQFCVKSYYGPHRDKLAIANKSQLEADFAAGVHNKTCYSAEPIEMGVDPAYNPNETDLLRLHGTALMDFMVGLTLIVFYWRFGKITADAIQDQDDDMTSMGDYTIQIVPDSIPIDTTKEQLRQWVEDRFGEGTVAKDQEIDGQRWEAITLCYDNDESIVLYQALGQLNDKRDDYLGMQSYHEALAGIAVTASEQKSEEKQVKKLQGKIDKVQKKIDKMQAKIDKVLDQEDNEPRDEKEPGRQTVSAFIVFEDDETYEDALMWEKVKKCLRFECLHDH